MSLHLPRGAADILARAQEADVAAHPLASARLRLGSLTVDCRLGHPYYAERLIEFFKGNLEAASASDDEHRDASVEIFGVPYDPDLFPGDESSFLHSILADAWPGGFSYTTCLCRVHVDTDSHPPRIVALVREPSPNLESLRLHFIRIIPKVIFSFEHYYLHASAIRFDGIVSVFTGPNHAGKSTLALRLAKDAAEVVADDHVLLSRRHGRFCLSGTDRHARVCAASERYLFEQPLATDPRLHGRLWKKEFSIDTYFSTSPYRDYPIDRLYFLSRGPAPEVRPLGRSQAVIRLLTLQGPDYLLSTNRPEESEAYLAYFTDLLRTVPAYEIVLTDDVADLDRIAPQVLFAQTLVAG